MPYRCKICCQYTSNQKVNLERHLLGRESRKHKSNQIVHHQIRKQLHELYPHKHQAPYLDSLIIKSDQNGSVIQQTNIQNNIYNYNQNTYNVLINNATLHPYTDPDESMLTKEEMETLLKDLPFSAPRMFRKIYLNDKVPQNHVILKNNLSSNEVMVLSKKGWINIKDQQLYDFFRQKYQGNMNNYLSYKEFNEEISVQKYDQDSNKLEQYERNNKALINNQIAIDLKNNRQLPKEKHRETKNLSSEELQSQIEIANGINETQWMKDRKLLMETIEARSLSDLDITTNSNSVDF